MDQSFRRQHLTPSAFSRDHLVKWNAAVLTEGFVPFPKTLLRSLSQLFPNSSDINDLATLLSVVDFRRVRQTREPSAKYLGFLAGLREAEISASLQRLQTRGLVMVEEDKVNDSVSVDYTKLLLWIEKHTQPSSESKG